MQFRDIYTRIAMLCIFIIFSASFYTLAFFEQAIFIIHEYCLGWHSAIVSSITVPQLQAPCSGHCFYEVLHVLPVAV